MFSQTLFIWCCFFSQVKSKSRKCSYFRNQHSTCGFFQLRFSGFFSWQWLPPVQMRRITLSWLPRNRVFSTRNSKIQCHYYPIFCKNTVSWPPNLPQRTILLSIINYQKFSFMNLPSSQKIQCHDPPSLKKYSVMTPKSPPKMQCNEPQIYPQNKCHDFPISSHIQCHDSQISPQNKCHDPPISPKIQCHGHPSLKIIVSWPLNLPRKYSTV